MNETNDNPELHKKCPLRLDTNSVINTFSIQFITIQSDK
jgi:hypothetical protein